MCKLVLYLLEIMSLSWVGIVLLYKLVIFNLFFCFGLKWVFVENYLFENKFWFLVFFYVN